MATAALQQLVVGAFSSSISAVVGISRGRRRRHIQSSTKFRCRGSDGNSSPAGGQNSGSYRFDLSSFYGRRALTFMATIPFVPDLHQLAQAAGEAESYIIRKEVMKVLSKGKAAGMLRLAFHDAGTFDMYDNSGGMNGSIIYELDRPENVGLRKSIKILDKAKGEIDRIQEDLIAVAGAEAVSLCGGPAILLQLGRVDVRIPDPEGKLPQESLDASALKNCFLEKGFLTQELVALSGAHTLGSKGFGNPNDFDNSYFKILLEKPWASSDASGMSKMIGLPSDRALVEDDECLRWIKIYADDEVRFFNDFRIAYTKLVNSGAHWRSV